MYSDGLLTGQNVSLSDALVTGGTTTLVGLSIVFSVLIILMIVLMLFKLIFRQKPKAQQVAVQSAKVQEQQAPVIDDNVDETELVAVLAAAVAASLNTSTYNLKIKSYRRIDNKMPAWNKAGVTETINNRF